MIHVVATVIQVVAAKKYICRNCDLCGTNGDLSGANNNDH